MGLCFLPVIYLGPNYGGLTAEVVETARELEVEPEAMTELLHYQDQTLTNEEWLLMAKQSK